MASINDKLSSEAIRHLHYVERYKTYQVRQIQNILKNAERAVRTKILEYGDAELVTKAKQQQLLKEIVSIQDAYNNKITKYIDDEYPLFAATEQKALLSQVKTAVPATLSDVYSFQGIEPSKLWAVISRNPISMTDGTVLTIDEFVNTFNIQNISKVTQVIQQGFLIGETPREITRRLTDLGIYSGRMKNAATMARTVLSHVQSEARDAVFAENDDIVKGYQWVSTLDSRTTSICANYDNKVWIFSGDKSGYDLLPGPVKPPAHYGCRSTTVPITKSYKELGIDINELSESTRASADGQVSESLTYYDWLVKQPDSVVKDVLGPTRFDMWKSGDVKIDQFYDDGKILTLAELEKTL